MRSTVATRDLRDELAAIAGVANVEVTLADGNSTTAHVWLDGTRDGDEVRDSVESLLGRSVSVVDPDEITVGKRSGLRKGLDSLAASAALDPIPVQLRRATVGRTVSVDRVTVVESRGSVMVEITDGAGHVFAETVGESWDIDGAVLDAVKQLTGASGDTRLQVCRPATDRSDLVVVEAFSGGTKAAGAAHVEFARPYAVARAALQALASL